MAERMIVAVVAADELRVFERNGDDHVVQIAQLRVRDGLDTDGALTLALTVAEAAAPQTPAPERAAHNVGSNGPLPNPGTPSSNDVYNWLAAHGPATHAEMKAVWPRSRAKALSNRLTLLQNGGRVARDERGQYRVIDAAKPLRKPPTAVTKDGTPRARAGNYRPTATELHKWLIDHSPATVAEMRAAFPDTPLKRLAGRRSTLSMAKKAHVMPDGRWTVS